MGSLVTLTGESQLVHEMPSRSTDPHPTTLQMRCKLTQFAGGHNTRQHTMREMLVYRRKHVFRRANTPVKLNFCAHYALTPVALCAATNSENDFTECTGDKKILPTREIRSLDVRYPETPHTGRLGQSADFEWIIVSYHWLRQKVAHFLRTN